MLWQTIKLSSLSRFNSLLRHREENMLEEIKWHLEEKEGPFGYAIVFDEEVILCNEDELIIKYTDFTPHFVAIRRKKA